MPINIQNRTLYAMRAEALEHNDFDMAAICDLAIAGEIDMDDYSGLSPAWSRRLRTMTQAQALAECVRAMDNHYAQEH